MDPIEQLPNNRGINSWKTVYVKEKTSDIETGRRVSSFQTEMGLMDHNSERNSYKEGLGFQNVLEGRGASVQSVIAAFRRRGEEWKVRREAMELELRESERSLERRHREDQAISNYLSKLESYHTNKIKDKSLKPMDFEAEGRELEAVLGRAKVKSMEGCTISNEGQAGRTSQSTPEGWKTKTQEILAVLRRQEEERRLEIEQFEIERRKKREEWYAEWRRMFNSFRGQDSDSEKPRVTLATVSRNEARVNGIVVSSAAVVQDHLDGGVEAASMSARATHCQEPVNCGEPEEQAIGNLSMEEESVWSKTGHREVFCRCSLQCCCIGSGITGRLVC